MDITNSWSQANFANARTAAVSFLDTVSPTAGPDDLIGMVVFTGRYGVEHSPMVALTDAIDLGLDDTWNALRTASKAGFLQVGGNCNVFPFANSRYTAPAFFGLASVGAYCWYRSPKKLNALIVVVVAVVFMLALAPATYWDEIASSTSDETMGDDGTGGARIYTWGIGMKMFFSNPIIGVGQSNFPWTFDEYQAGSTFHTRSFAGRQAHSAWVTLISELGLAGIIIVGGMLFQCYRDLKWIRRRFAPAEPRQKPGQTVQAGEDMRAYLARAMEGSLIGFIVSGVFVSTLWYPALWTMIAFVVALRNISETQSEGVLPVAVQSKHPWGVSLPQLGGRPISRL